VDVYIRLFLTSAPVGSNSIPGRFIPGERVPSPHRAGGWVGPRTGLDEIEKRQSFPLPELELQPLDRPARSHSLYQLRPSRLSLSGQYS
jgi:hypothetical protein